MRNASIIITGMEVPISAVPLKPSIMAQFVCLPKVNAILVIIWRLLAIVVWKIIITIYWTKNALN